MVVSDDARQKIRAIIKKNVQDREGLLVVGINGPPGCGKSMMVAKLINELSQDGIACDTLCLDDYYYPREVMNSLATDNDTIFGWRGNPGTHDVSLLTKHLQDLIRRRIVNSPVYDKLANGGKGERAHHQRQIDGSKIQVVLLEGWMIGFLAPPNASQECRIDALLDESLRKYYPIWNLVDLWLLLRPSENLDELQRILCADRWQQHVTSCKQRGLSPESVLPVDAFKEYIDNFQPALRRYYTELPRLLGQKVNSHQLCVFSTTTATNKGTTKNE
jgi:pantothenate kinase-related protein Tda10